MSYDFTIEVLKEGAVVGRAPADLAPCLEDIRFRAVVMGDVPNDGSVPPVRVAPVWHEVGSPIVAAVRLSLGEAAGARYGRDVFAPRAEAVVAALVRDKVLADGDTVVWRVVAAPSAAEAPSRFRARATRAPYPLRPGSLPQAEPGTFGVVLGGDVIDAIRAAVVASKTVECAGLLTGELVHDRERGVAALRVTDQVPLPPGAGGASDVHFSFGPETFAAARRALAESGAECVGWTHSHPPCERCPERPECTADLVFFSRDDHFVHAGAFQAPYMIGLVAGKVASQPATRPGFRLYGWAHGAVVEVPLDVVAATHQP